MVGFCCGNGFRNVRSTARQLKSSRSKNSRKRRTTTTKVESWDEEVRVLFTKEHCRLKAVCFERPEHERNLSLYFASVMQEGRLLDIIDGRLVDHRNIEELKEVATLARRCVRLKGDERPSMKEVASELKGFRAMGKFRQEEGPDSIKNHVISGIYGARLLSLDFRVLLVIQVIAKQNLSSNFSTNI
ncbi:hypothetical protein V6N13_049746 [Hibiscus sabdariffa]